MQDISLRGLRVLILEDEILIALDLEQIFRDLGVDEVIVARNLDDVAADATFDVAVLDLMLAGRSTVEFASVQFAKGVPFVFATGRSDAAQLLSDLPDVPIVDKPFSNEALVRAIAKAMTRGRDGVPDSAPAS